MIANCGSTNDPYLSSRKFKIQNELKSFRLLSSRRRGSGSASDHAATESEQDEQPVVRPKLSYKKKGSSRHYRSKSSHEVGPRSAAKSPSQSVGGFESDLRVPHTNPDGDDWGDEEPYARPKLSYSAGGSLSSSRRGSFPFDSVPGVFSSSRS